MIIGYFSFLVLGIAVFFFMAKVGLPLRIIVSLAAFLIPSFVLTVWVVHVGDKPSSDAVTIIPEPNNKTEQGGTDEAG